MRSRKLYLFFYVSNIKKTQHFDVMLSILADNWRLQDTLFSTLRYLLNKSCVKNGNPSVAVTVRGITHFQEKAVYFQVR